jgi:hypothetical protein
MNMLKPLNCVVVEYKTFIVKMWHNIVYVVKAGLNLYLLCDLHMLMDLSCFLPLLEVVNALIKFVHGRYVFICDFVVIVKVCQSYLFMMYLDPMNNYTREHFQVFSNVVEINSTSHPRLGYWPQHSYGNFCFSYG